MYAIAVYLYINKVISKVLRLDFSDPSTIYNYKFNLEINSPKRYSFTSPIVFNTTASSKLNSESLLLKEMFCLKQVLDFKLDYLPFSRNNTLNIETDSSFYLLDSYVDDTDSVLSSSISNLENSYL
jgi:hypothetical protein